MASKYARSPRWVPTSILGAALLLSAAGATPRAEPAQGVAAPARGPVKVFILAGQSNMEGKALASTLEPLLSDPETRDHFQHLKTGGKWSVRDDVQVAFLDRGGRGGAMPVHGPLSVGFGGVKSVRDAEGRRVPAPTIGPELGIGDVLGDHFAEPVLLIKAAWGGRAVKYTFRPPSAMPTGGEIRERLAQLRRKRPELTFEEVKESYGRDYRKILSETHRALDEIEKYVPGYDPKLGWEISGFIWFQGWNDGVGRGNPDYVEHMAHFIRDLRRDLGRPRLPFVIGELGIDGPEATGWIATFRAQQAAIAALKEFEGTVALARTARCWHAGPAWMKGKWEEFRAAARANESRPAGDPTRVDPREFFRKNWLEKYKEGLAYTSDRRYHYNGSGRSYYEMGESMGHTMLELLEAEEGEGRATDSPPAPFGRAMMMKLLPIAALALLPRVLAADLPKVEVRDVRKVFDDGKHDAFTDLTRFQGRFYLAFRSCPDGHGVSPNASVIILASEDAREWKRVHAFRVPKRDTRDPHFLAFKGRLFVYTGTWYSGAAPARSRADLELNLHLGYGVWSAGGVEWSKPILLEGTFGHYVWRAAAWGGKAYLCARRKIGFEVGPRGEPDQIESLMLESDDGLVWRKRATFQEISGDETAFLFEADGSVLGIGRRRGTAQLLRSKPPYTKWERRDLDRPIGGPLLAKWGERTIVGGRHSTSRGPRTSLCWLAGDELHEFCELPSGGDNSYPGFVALSESEALVSWYSSHEGTASIYTARLELRRGEARR